MDKEQLKLLKSKNVAQINIILNKFNKENADLLVFDKFHRDNQWHDLWMAIFSILEDKNQSAELHILCLNTVRILTRDEYSLQTNYIKNELNTLLRIAQLTNNAGVFLSIPEGEPRPTESMPTVIPSFESKPNNDITVNVVAETIKCLCNLIYQSSDCRRYCLHYHIIDALLKRIASNSRGPNTLEYYDIKLLFLMTALEPSARSRLQIDLNGITYMTKWLDDKLSEPNISDDEMNTISELLKVMFNVTSSPDKSPNEYEIQGLHLTNVLRELLLRFGDLDNERKYNVVSHAINLLTNINGSCLTKLTIKCNSEKQCHKIENNDDGTTTSVIQSNVHNFEQRNVCALEVLLRYLRQALAQQELEATSYELLSPVLTVLVKCARSNRVMRHYLRKEILPPLRDVSQRPEIGNELRNHLCRFLTLPAMILRDLSAELLFVLCKENVGRMIKYTGYGNAAGLFASRGLLDCRRIEPTAEYSSDSEDSDTEEYKRLQDGINPVLGCYDKSTNKHNFLDDMTEEQKEYEAMQLVGLIDKLHKSGIVQPCRIGEDGKPKPLEHILQLQEELPQQQLEQKLL